MQGAKNKRAHSFVPTQAGYIGLLFGSQRIGWVPEAGSRKCSNDIGQGDRCQGCGRDLSDLDQSMVVANWRPRRKKSM